jgi:hypothetical protein
MSKKLHDDDNKSSSKPATASSKVIFANCLEHTKPSKSPLLLAQGQKRCVPTLLLPKPHPMLTNTSPLLGPARVYVLYVYTHLESSGFRE